MARQQAERRDTACPSQVTCQLNTGATSAHSSHTGQAGQEGRVGGEGTEPFCCSARLDGVSVVNNSVPTYSIIDEWFFTIVISLLFWRNIVSIIEETAILLPINWLINLKLLLKKTIKLHKVKITSLHSVKIDLDQFTNNAALSNSALTFESESRKSGQRLTAHLCINCLLRRVRGA